MAGVLRRLRDRAALAGAEGTVGAAVAGIGAATGSVPVGILGALIQPALNMAAEAGMRRAAQVAVDVSGLTVQELLVELNRSEDSRRLLAVTMEAARTAVHDDRLRMLGLGLAAGVAPGAVLIEELALVRAVAVLEPAHLRLLHVMSGKNSRLDPASQDVAAWTEDDVTSEVPDISVDVFQVLIGGVLAQGVAASFPISTWSGSRYRVTPLGRRLLTRATEAAAVSPPAA